VFPAKVSKLAIGVHDIAFARGLFSPANQNFLTLNLLALAIIVFARLDSVPVEYVFVTILHP